jgi:hypothetical protein
MRRSPLLIVSLLLLLASTPGTLAAQIHVVNPDGTGDFITIQAALDAPSVVNGDTIFVVFGVYNESIVIRKGITLMGGGYFNPEGNPTHLFTTQGIGIQFATGASGAVLQGFFVQAHSNQTALRVEQGVSDVIIRENHIQTEGGQAIISNQSGPLLIEHNYVRGGSASLVSLSRPTSVTVRNNVIRSQSSSTLTLDANGVLFEIYNNVFIGSSSTVNIGGSTNGGSSFYSNIVGTFTAGSTYSISTNPFFFGFNHTWRLGGTALNNPTFMVPDAFSDGDPLFVNYASPNDGVVIGTSDFRLRPESQAIDRGRIGPGFNDIDGTRNDPGVFGGPFPFKTAGGTPAIPVVIALEVTPARVQPGGTIQVRVTGKIGQ